MTTKIAAVVAVALTVAIPVAVRADDGAKLVDDLRGVFGKHHQSRPAHAKGIVLDGVFTPTAEAKALSSNAVFAGDAVPVTLRFSNFAGIPTVADNAHETVPMGLALKLCAANARALDVVTHSFNGFPVATAAEFSELLRAIAASGADAPKPTALDRFLAAHPNAAHFLKSQKLPPASFATAAYFGVNAFAFVDAAGNKTFVRYRFVPQAGESYVDEATRKGLGPNYLREEMNTRLARSPAQFDWYAQIAEAGDKLDDPSSAWPETRRLVKLGTLRIDRIAADEGTAHKTLVFMPGAPPPGIEAADPMLAARNAAYSRSFDERQ
jgi:catalase